jgi:hypothetical protein
MEAQVAGWADKRLAAAAKAVMKDEAKALAKFIKLTGRIPADRVDGYQTRHEMLKGIKK